MKYDNIREEFRTALVGEASYDELLQIVRRHKATGIGQRETYAILESIREELGCHDGADNYVACECIDDVMDVVWGYCNQSQAIWTTSLGDEENE